jgi:hypothetical protein
VKTGEKNVHGGNIFYPFCDMGENITPWGWGTQNLCAKTGTDSGAGSCVNFRKSLGKGVRSIKMPLPAPQQRVACSFGESVLQYF